MFNKLVVRSYSQLLENTMKSLSIFDNGLKFDETEINNVYTLSKDLVLSGTRDIHRKSSKRKCPGSYLCKCIWSIHPVHTSRMTILKWQRLNRGLVAKAPKGALFATSKISFIDR